MNVLAALSIGGVLLVIGVIALFSWGLKRTDVS